MTEGGDHTEEPLGSFADKLDYLFRNVYPRERGEYSYREVAASIEAAGGPTVSPTYLMYLRKGQRTNPTLQHLEAIARFFGVPPAYFLDEDIASLVADQVKILAILRNAGVRNLALRAADLSPEALAAVARLIEQLHSTDKSTPG